jgi:mannosyltransferase OCH1-like enzyme
MIVHQVFGLLDDGSMNDLFLTNQKIVMDWCSKNNYDYKLWTADDCTELIKKYYIYIDLYNSVKYKIMKVDIIRFIILYEHGGLYIDLDCIPNIDKIKDNNFIVSYKIGLKREHYELEIIQSLTKNNSILLEYLDYVKTQIEEKDKIDIYKIWKGRYIYHTSGPYCFSRFIKNKNIDKYIINEPLTKDKSLNLNGNEEFISYPSCSYLN